MAGRGKTALAVTMEILLRQDEEGQRVTDLFYCGGADSINSRITYIVEKEKSMMAEEQRTRVLEDKRTGGLEEQRTRGQEDWKCCSVGMRKSRA